MAIVAKPTCTVSYTLLDSTGSQATATLDLPYATLVADAEIKADGMRPLIGALTGCAITGQSITYSKIETAQPAPAAGSRVERKGVFVLRTAVAKSVTYQIPGIIDGIVVTSTGRINEDIASVVAFTDELFAAGPPAWTDSNAQTLTGLSKAYERFRGSTRAMLPNQKSPDADADAATT